MLSRPLQREREEAMAIVEISLQNTIGKEINLAQALNRLQQREER